MNAQIEGDLYSEEIAAEGGAWDIVLQSINQETDTTVFLKAYWKEVLKHAISNRQIEVATKLMQAGVVLENRHFKYLQDYECLNIYDNVNNPLLLQAAEQHFLRPGAIQAFISRSVKHDYTENGCIWALRISMGEKSAIAILLYIAIQSYLNKKSYRDQRDAFKCIKIILNKGAANLFQKHDDVILKALGNYMIMRKKGYFGERNIPAEREETLREILEMVRTYRSNKKLSDKIQRHIQLESKISQLKTGFFGFSGRSLLKTEVKKALLYETQHGF